MRQLIDDSILVLAAVLKASVDVELKPTAPTANTADDSSDDSRSDVDATKEPALDEASADPLLNDVEVQRLRWDGVARGVQALVRAHDVTIAQETALLDARRGSNLKSAVRHSEMVSDLNGGMCQQRARYLIWKTNKEAKSHKSNASGFNVARGDSIGQRIQAIMAEAARNLPTTLRADDEPEDDDDDTPIAVYQPPPGYHQATEEELAEQVALAQAEDDFLQKVQHMQTEFYQKHKKWVEVDVEQLLTGNLQKISPTKAPAKSEIKSASAPAPTATKSAPVTTAAQHSVRQVYSAVRGTNSVAEQVRAAVELGRGEDSDPLAALKRAANPHAHRRPPRPSQMTEDDYGEEGSADDDDANEAQIAAAYRAKAAAVPLPSKHVDPWAAPAAPAAPAAAPAAAAPSSKTVTPAAPVTTAPPARGGRWTIVEYDDDDDDDDDGETA